MNPEITHLEYILEKLDQRPIQQRTETWQQSYDNTLRALVLARLKLNEVSP